MVKSGLVNDVTVSHYRLSIHLTNSNNNNFFNFLVIKNIISKKKKFFLNFQKNIYLIKF